MPVTSHICEPLKDAVVEGDEVTGARVGMGLFGMLCMGAKKRCPRPAHQRALHYSLHDALLPCAAARSQGLRMERRRPGHHSGGRVG
jgi:hypothetical protein